MHRDAFTMLAVRLAPFVVLASISCVQPQPRPPAAYVPGDVGGAAPSKLISSSAVSTEAALRRAVSALGTAGGTVIIDSMIAMSSSLAITCDSIVLIGQPGKRCGFDFSKLPGPKTNEWWNEGQFWCNGIEIRARSARISGLVFSDFQLRGGALKLQSFKFADVTGCTFRRCSSVQRPPSRFPPPDASYAWYGAAIEGHGDGIVRIWDCQFENCATSASWWSHCLYLDEAAVDVRNCTVTGSADFAGCTGNVVLVQNCTIANPATALSPRGQQEAPRVVGCPPDGALLFCGNRISGQYGTVFGGRPVPRRHVIDGNDYSGTTYTMSFASDNVAGKWISTSEWSEMGFDRNSKR